jgi:hypothetical protein
MAKGNLDARAFSSHTAMNAGQQILVVWYALSIGAPSQLPKEAELNSIQKGRLASTVQSTK